jgi:hypothetical protein
MSTTSDAWIQVVSVRPELDARAEFRRWELENPEWRTRLSVDDIRFDLLCGPGTNGMRVMVKDRRNRPAE